jgi:hypothetical protein
MANDNFAWKYKRYFPTNAPFYMLKINKKAHFIYLYGYKKGAFS